VRCQRCDRPVCPECQRPAAVGFQCVDCVREQAKTVRTGRTTFGGQVQQSGSLSATKVILGLCVVAYVGQWLVPGQAVTRGFMYVPALTLTEPWRLLTAAFLHSPGFLLHIVFNMYALWLGGPYLEQLLGRARFVALYLLSAVGGSVGVFLLASPGVESQSWWTPVVGASGAVFGLWGAITVVHRRLRRDNGGMIALLLINTVIGFFPGLSIAWQAHLGGLVTGALAGAVIAYSPPARRAVLHPAGLAAVGALMVVLILVKASTVPAGLI
jgi:membrane associated rhomboid family serine protease